MTHEAGEILCEPVLIKAGWTHGFGTRGAQVPADTAFPRQVHGVRVTRAGRWSESDAPEADAILTSPERPCVGIVTADCVPILVAARRGGAAIAIHAGWRGFAAGVIEAGVRAVQQQAEAGAVRDAAGLDDSELGWVAAIGPAARGCCYEVDAPVREALEEKYSAWLEPPILVPGRPGHHQLDLPALAVEVLAQMGLERAWIGREHQVCTVCHPDLFESYRRDGPAAGRLRHFIDGAGRFPAASG
jgi:YfiH family protein